MDKTKFYKRMSENLSVHTPGFSPNCRSQWHVKIFAILENKLFLVGHLVFFFFKKKKNLLHSHVNKSKFLG